MFFDLNSFWLFENISRYGLDAPSFHTMENDNRKMTATTATSKSDTKLSNIESTATAHSSETSVSKRAHDYFAFLYYEPTEGSHQQTFFQSVRTSLIWLFIIFLLVLTFFRRKRNYWSYWLACLKVKHNDEATELALQPSNSDLNAEDMIDSSEEAEEDKPENSPEYWENRRLQQEEEIRNCLMQQEIRKQKRMEKQENREKERESQREKIRQEAVSAIITKLQLPIMLESNKLNNWLNMPD